MVDFPPCHLCCHIRNSRRGRDIGSLARCRFSAHEPPNHFDHCNLVHYPRYFFASACKRRPKLLERESHHKTLSPRRLSQQSFPQTSSLQRPSKTLLNMLTQIHTNLWTIHSISMSFVNAETNTSMTVAKLSNGSLWINSPIAWKTDVLRLLSAWVAE